MSAQTMKIVITLLTLVSFMRMMHLLVHAQEYILELQQIEATNEAQLKPKISNEHLTELTSYGYTIMSKSEKPTEIFFSIDRTSIAFADLNQGGSFIENINLEVKSSTNGQYQIITKLLSPLSSSSGETIKLTSCDDTCSPRNAKTWQSTDVYGWGYSIDEGKTYRTFSHDTSVSLFPSSPSQSKSQITVKVQTPTNQPEGNFQGIVHLIALPDL